MGQVVLLPESPTECCFQANNLAVHDDLSELSWAIYEIHPCTRSHLWEVVEQEIPDGGGLGHIDAHAGNVRLCLGPAARYRPSEATPMAI